MHITVNGESQQIAERTTVARLLEDLNLAGKPVAVEVNLKLVPRQHHDGHQLAENDLVEIVTLVGGG